MKYVRILKMSNGKYVVQGKNKFFSKWTYYCCLKDEVKFFDNLIEADNIAKQWKSLRIKEIVKYIH